MTKQWLARAYQLWEKADKPEGRDDEFWHLAEQELLNVDKGSPLRPPTICEDYVHPEILNA